MPGEVKRMGGRDRGAGRETGGQAGGDERMREEITIKLYLSSRFFPDSSAAGDRP